MSKKFTVALCGNPNCGKTTLFNALTGAKQYVGNWPGVTVECKEGKLQYANEEITVVDLPGIYSFSAQSLDQKEARDFIIKLKPDVVINILDASNLERNLYLTTQLLEMEIKVVVALNMMDIVRQRKIKIDLPHLASHLNCPVIPISASKKENLDTLLAVTVERYENPTVSKIKVEYDGFLEDFIEKMSNEVVSYAQKGRVNSRWLAIRLLDEDDLAQEITENVFRDKVEQIRIKVEKHVNEPLDVVIADGKYGFIRGLIKDVADYSYETRRTVTELIDRIALNRFFALPFFFIIMYIVFFITINVGGIFIDFMDIFTGAFTVDGFAALLEKWHAPAGLIAILSGGLGAGIQTVATFVPPIFFIFLTLSILEDSGYMARAAFVMDRFMRSIGLPGKAFIPMLVGFGCNVPAIMSTRTLEDKRERILSILMNPFISCGARLPVYTLFIAAFFPKNGGTLLFLLYLLGALAAIFTGFLMKKTILKGESSSFVMELPPYHIPTFNGIILHTWFRLKGFVIRAGKMIIMVVIVMSLLTSIGVDGTFKPNNEKSILTYLGQKLTPLFAPMGLANDNWEAVVGLATGVFAKEAVVGTLSTLYGADAKEDTPFNLKEQLTEAVVTLRDNAVSLKNQIFDPAGVKSAEEDAYAQASTFSKFREKFKTPASVWAYLVFVLLYIPCLAVIATINKEIGSLWAAFSVGYTTFIAWNWATMTYQILTFRYHPASSGMWIGFCLLLQIALYGGLKFSKKRHSYS